MAGADGGYGVAVLVDDTSTDTDKDLGIPTSGHADAGEDAGGPTPGDASRGSDEHRDMA